VAKLELPAQPELASKVVESQTRREEKALEMGWVGFLFGSGSEKPGNIAGIVIALSIIALIIIFFIGYFYPNTNNAPTRELITLFGGIVTLALGYLFGKSGKE
jgi:hypothetical protein